MQVERHHIGGSEGTLGQVGEEEFIHHSVADAPDLPFLFLLRWGWMSCHNEADEGTVLVQVLVWTVVEGAADPAFLAAQLLGSRQVQASLNSGEIKEAVVFASRDI